jgi:hypothetical protein
MPLRTLPIINDILGTNFPFENHGNPELADEMIRNLEIIVLKAAPDADVARRVLKSFALHEQVQVLALVIDVAYHVQISRNEDRWHPCLTELLAPMIRRQARFASFESWVQRGERDGREL